MGLSALINWLLWGLGGTAGLVVVLVFIYTIVRVGSRALYKSKREFEIERGE